MIRTVIGRTLLTGIPLVFVAALASNPVAAQDSKPSSSPPAGIPAPVSNLMSVTSPDKARGSGKKIGGNSENNTGSAKGGLGTTDSSVRGITGSSVKD